MLAPLGEWHEQGRHWHRLTLTGKDSTTTITGAIDVREAGLDPTFRLRIDAHRIHDAAATPQNQVGSK